MEPITDVRVKLTGENGSAFNIMGKVRKALKEAGYGQFLIIQYTEEATSCDYVNLLKVTMKYVYIE